MRLISSGIARSKLRRPASTWATRMPSLAQTSVHARVEFTSPTTTTQSGPSAMHTASNASITRAVCTAWEPEPTPRLTSGSGRPSSSKNTLDIRSS